MRHCYEEENALALIIAPAKRAGRIGVVGDLEGILDIWRNGNRDKDGKRIDNGIGLEYSDPYNDPETKDTTVDIHNKHGGISQVILISIPYPSLVARRMKAMSPSFVFFDEITETESDEYFTYVALQLGRRKKYEIKGPQQFYASCNPEGPSHWVYDVYYVRCIDENGKRDPDFEVYHFSIEENKHNLPDGYYENQVIPTLRDEVDRRRLVDGEWVDRPSGDAIFKDYFNQDLHVRPQIGSEEHRRGIGLMPHPGIPIMVGYDPGPNNYCIAFMQMIPVKNKGIWWIVFDELNFVGEHRPDFYVAKKLVEKLDFWTNKTGGMCRFVHVADQTALSHQRNDGSFDATRMRTLTKGRVVMRPFSQNPDSKGSVPARVGMVRSLMANDSFYISATCPRTIESVRLLSSKKQKPGEYNDLAGLMPKRSPYLHPFDAFSYPIFYSQLYPSAFVLQTDQVEATKSSSVFRAGSG